MRTILEYRYENEKVWKILQTENDPALIEDSYVWDLMRDNNNKIIRVREVEE